MHTVILLWHVSGCGPLSLNQIIIIIIIINLYSYSGCPGYVTGVTGHCQNIWGRSPLLQNWLVAR